MRMPTTVKSLEERLDEFSEELVEMGVRLDEIKSNQFGTQAAIAVLTTRIDTLRENLNASQAQLATLASSLNATQAQIAVLTVRLDSLADQLRVTNVRLDAVMSKLDLIVTEHMALKAKTDTTLGLIKWVGAFSAGAILMFFGTGVGMIRTASSLETNVLQQQKSLDQQQRSLDEIKQQLSELRKQK